MEEWRVGGGRESDDVPCVMASSRTPLTVLVRDRRGPRSARDAPAARRPDDRRGTADHAIARDRTEFARVLGVRAVVAQDEDGAPRHRDGPEVDAVDGVGVGVALVLPAAVDDEDPVLDADALAAGGDDALQEDLARARGVEGDEVAAVRRAGELVDERLV